MTDPKLFFALGAPKSGTTWLQSILNHHPDVMCRGEGAFHHFGREMLRAADWYNTHLEGKNTIFGETAFPKLKREEFRVVFRTFVLGRLEAALKTEKTKKPTWFGEKDPDHATFCDVMMEAFPEAAFIHIIRDGRDQSISMRHHVQKHSGRMVERDDTRESAMAWSNLIRKVRQVRKSTGVRYHELRYEDLIDKPEKTVEALFEFLDVPRDSKIIAHCLEKSDFKNFSGGREPGQEDVSSFFRKGVKGDWRDKMSDQQVQVFLQATQGLMKELGYA